MEKNEFADAYNHFTQGFMGKNIKGPIWKFVK